MSLHPVQFALSTPSGGNVCQNGPRPCLFPCPALHDIDPALLALHVLEIGWNWIGATGWLLEGSGEHVLERWGG